MSPRIGQLHPRRRRGFTFLELLIVVLILGITASMALGMFSRVEGALRPVRAGRELVTALRYARTLAMTTGAVHGVKVDTRNNCFLVCSAAAPAVAVPQPLGANGVFLISLASGNLAGVAMTPTPAADASGQTFFTYNPIGTCTNPGNVVMGFGDQQATVRIPAVGDPSVQ